MKKRKVEVPDTEIDNLNNLFLKSCIVIDEKSKKYAFYHLNKNNKEIIEDVIKTKGKNYTWHDIKRATDDLFNKTVKNTVNNNPLYEK